MNYKTQGVCSREVSFDVKDNKITNVVFKGGCSGNTQGVARLIEGMDIDEADLPPGRDPLRHASHILSRTSLPGLLNSIRASSDPLALLNRLYDRTGKSSFPCPPRDIM